jgi:phosphomannomutase
MLSEIFKAYDIRATYPDKINEDAARKVGLATGRFLKNQAVETQGPMAHTVLVSRDMRPHSPQLAKALIDGLLTSGVNVIDLGMCDTSFIYFAVNHFDCAGGVQTTASHNPINYNGFKISGRHAAPIGGTTGLKEIQTIAESLDHGVTRADGPPGKLQQHDIWPDYRRHVLKFFKPGQRKLKVFIDASNGMAGKMVPYVFGDQKYLQIVPLNFEITGSFVHEPNPLVARNMAPTQAGVLQHQADMGVCFDGDADRCILTDEKGQIIGCDHLTAWLAAYFLRGAPGSAVAYDLRSSRVVKETIERCGGKPVRGRVGHVFMKALMRQTNAVFGGELSGHFYFHDNFFADSGAITFAAAASVLSQSDRPLSELIAPYRRYPQSGETNYRVADKTAVMDLLHRQYRHRAAIDDLDGVTIDAWDRADGGWWFNVRPSNTEPLLRLNAEAKDRPTLEGLLAELAPHLGSPDTGGH